MSHVVDVARTSVRGFIRRFVIGNEEVLVFNGLYAKRTQRLICEHLRGATFTEAHSIRALRRTLTAVRWRRSIDLAANKLPSFSDVVELMDELALGFVLDRVYA